MKICRYALDGLRVGVVAEGMVFDISSIVRSLPSLRWPFPLGDQLATHLETLQPEIHRLQGLDVGRVLSEVRLLSPIANPGKIIGAPANYAEHIAEAQRDPTLSRGHAVRPLRETGMFLKATSSLVGPSEGIAQRFLDRRNDPEVELAVIIGKTGTRIAKDEALEYVLGYSVGIDMTVRGPEFQCFRKSIDSYAVLGPWLVTKDEVNDPNDLELRLWVNGEKRQDGSTRDLICDVQTLIEYASSFYTLHPGDIIMTGTPAGVGPIKPGDLIRAEIRSIGSMEIAVRAA